MKQARAKPNTNKTTKPRNRNSSTSNKRTKSLEDWKFMKNELKDKIKGRNSLVKKVERSISAMDKKKEKK